MKIGVSSYSFASYLRANHCSYFDVCDQAKRIGFDSIEFINLNWPDVIQVDDEIALAKEIKAYCEKIGLTIAAYTVGADLLAADIEAEKEKVRHCIDVAEALGAPLVRHDLCYTLPEEYRYTWQNAMEKIVPSVRELTRYAASKGIKTCSENHGFIFQDAERVEALIREVNDPNYGWLVDIGNFICADGDLTKSARIAAPYAIHVHAKDFLWKPGTEEKPEGWDESACGNYYRGTVLGHGVVPIRRSLQIIQKAGYQGTVSLEFEGWEDNLIALETGYAFLKKTIG